jgi:hypothetical protein
MATPDALLSERASLPADEQPRIDARLAEMARELRGLSECGVLRF